LKEKLWLSKILKSAGVLPLTSIGEDFTGFISWEGEKRKNQEHKPSN